MAIFSATSYPFVLLSRSKRPPLDILKFLVTTLRNQEHKVAFIRVDEDGALARSSEFMKKCHNTNIIFQTKVGYASYLNGKRESPNKTLANIKKALLLKSIYNKEFLCFTYQYSIWLSRRTENRVRGDVTYFSMACNKTFIQTYKNMGCESLHHHWMCYKKET